MGKAGSSVSVMKGERYGRGGGFRRGVLDRRSGFERMCYWVAALPGILVAIAIIAVIGQVGSEVSGAIERERTIETGAEAVRRGMEKYDRSHW